jgi:prepilin-type N-terminal cleavage/methylation domain-containing protein
LNAAARQHGFSFVEIMVAVLVLAICAVPLADAVRNGIAASTVGADKARELRCMKTMMETVLAEPYLTLRDAALGMSKASRYSQPAAGGCVRRNVFIAKYEREAGKPEVFLDDGVDSTRLESPMLYVTVSSPDSGYSFTTLVAR